VLIVTLLNNQTFIDTAYFNFVQHIRSEIVRHAGFAPTDNSAQLVCR